MPPVLMSMSRFALRLRDHAAAWAAGLIAASTLDPAAGCAAGSLSGRPVGAVRAIRRGTTGAPAPGIRRFVAVGEHVASVAPPSSTG
eukprot:14215310-Heterocapsa_arctica.AAC.1